MQDTAGGTWEPSVRPRDSHYEPSVLNFPPNSVDIAFTVSRLYPCATTYHLSKENYSKKNVIIKKASSTKKRGQLKLIIFQWTLNGGAMSHSTAIVNRSPTRHASATRHTLLWWHFINAGLILICVKNNMNLQFYRVIINQYLLVQSFMIS